MKEHAFLLLTSLVTGVVAAQTNARCTFSLDAPCGGTIVGPPGTTYDDGTGGAPYFLLRGKRPGHTWDVRLTTEDNPSDGFGAHTWGFSLGVEGPLWITDITTNGTVGCSVLLDFPECRVTGGGFWLADLTGPPDGLGPQTEDNTGAASFVILKFDGVVTLPPEGSEVVCKVRVSGEFPKTEGEMTTGKIFFATRSNGRNVPPQVYVGPEIPITPERGNPPLKLEECVVTLKASSVSAFIRCDPNEDGRLTISDAVWIASELFLANAVTRCPAAADCDGDGERKLADAIYALSYLFLGTLQPPAPFAECERLDIPEEDCPPQSTVCP